MNPNIIYEDEINLKDLVVYICRKWKIIIFVSVVLAMLLGGYKIFDGLKDL